MALPSTFSRRKREQSEANLDPLRYDEITLKVRTQIIHIFDDANEIIRADWSNRRDNYELLAKFFRKELGVEKLARGTYADEEFKNWFFSHTVVDEIIDAIEIICRLILVFRDSENYVDRKSKLDDCVSEINARMLEDRLGYQFEAGQMVQADSQFTHKEITLPALQLISDRGFEGAEAEFRAAHRAFRERDYGTTLVESCKALESVLKAIFDEKGWDYNTNDALKGLLKIAFENGLIPKYMQSEFTGLRTILENGVGTVRNKVGGHGAGRAKRSVPKEVAAFQLHQTAAAIRFLIELSNSD